MAGWIILHISIWRVSASLSIGWRPCFSKSALSMAVDYSKRGPKGKARRLMFDGEWRMAGPVWTRRRMCAKLFAKSAVAGVRARGKWPVGVCSWSYEKPVDVVAAEMAKIGVNRIHLALGPALAGDKAYRAAVEKHLAAGDFTLSAAMIGFAHEDWTTLDSIRRTGGIVPDAYWAEYKKTIAPAAKLAAAWKAPYLTLHAGFLDESRPAALAKYTDRVKFIRDACAASGIGLLLETGQETAADLAKFLPTVEGVGVNLDPANMILYAKGDPVAAVKLLSPWIRH